MILRLGLNAAVHTVGGMVLGMLAVGAAMSACRYANCKRKQTSSSDSPANSPQRDMPTSTEAPPAPV